ncbi:MAG: VIT1/CCC1 transporter family protein [Candidatus Magasanikiibacteriota bacterium]
MSTHAQYNPNFLHHKHGFVYFYSREIVFGIQDGMVSLLGALTGIAVGSKDHFTIVLSGLSIIFTAALSMAIGTYNSLSTKRKMESRILDEEREEIAKSLSEEKKEVEILFIEDGWPKELAKEMAESASQNNDLMLKEMAYRELGITTRKSSQPIQKSIVMFFSWILGGFFPLLPYLFLYNTTAIIVSIIMTLVGLFVLGVAMSRFTKQKVFFAGLEIVLIGGVAIICGYLIGSMVDLFIQH